LRGRGGTAAQRKESEQSAGKGVLPHRRGKMKECSLQDSCKPVRFRGGGGMPKIGGGGESVGDENEKK